ncbi:hypothetical protein AGMMS4956_18800 [Bacteroidia bacterium]|nr:hypothetical protein AGMMS4956_18800 [Bacteroidia bacterium]
MGYIEREEEFRQYMINSKTQCNRSVSDYISRLRFLANNGININSTLSDNDSILDKLKATENKRTKYRSKEGYSSLGSALNKYRNFINHYGRP